MSTTNFTEEKRVEIGQIDLPYNWKGDLEWLVLVLLASVSILFWGNLSPEGWTLLPLNTRIVIFTVLLVFLLIYPKYKLYKYNQKSLESTIVLTNDHLQIYYNGDLGLSINEVDITSIQIYKGEHFKVKFKENKQMAIIFSTPEKFTAIKNLLLNIRAIDLESDPLPSKYKVVQILGILLVLGLNLAFIISRTPLIIFLTGLLVLPCLYIVVYNKEDDRNKVKFSLVFVLFILALIKIGATLKYLLF